MLSLVRPAPSGVSGPRVTARSWWTPLRQDVAFAVLLWLGEMTLLLAVPPAIATPTTAWAPLWAAIGLTPVALRRRTP